MCRRTSHRSFLLVVCKNFGGNQWVGTGGMMYTVNCVAKENKPSSHSQLQGAVRHLQHSPCHGMSSRPARQYTWNPLINIQPVASRYEIGYYDGLYIVG